MRLDFHLSAPRLAPLLIGWELCAHGVRGRIVETEAYQGEDDLACHASKGRTPRSEVLYAEPGTLYLYLVYGMHVLLNIVCDAVDRPAAVLIRAIEIVDGEELARTRRNQPTCRREKIANGPGKVTQALRLDLAQNRLRLGASACPLTLGPPRRRPTSVVSGPRVGVAYAGPEWSRRPWRWWEAGFPVVGGRNQT